MWDGCFLQRWPPNRSAFCRFHGIRLISLPFGMLCSFDSKTFKQACCFCLSSARMPGLAMLIANAKKTSCLSCSAGTGCKNILRCHPAWYHMIPSYAYKHTPTSYNALSMRLPYFALSWHFCLPSEVHSIEYHMLRFHRPQLSLMWGKRFTTLPHRFPWKYHSCCLMSREIRFFDLTFLV